MNEEWRRIEGFPLHYQVSNMGQVRGKGGRLLKPNKKGRVFFYIYGKQVVSFLVATLVARAFLDDRTKRHPYVRHIDGNPDNNRADNLEWSSCGPAAKKVEVWRDGALIAQYKSAIEAARGIKVPLATISRACRNKGKLKKFPGLYVRYAPAEEE